eukprot:1334288-Rhodomonas_salina.2
MGPGWSGTGGSAASTWLHASGAGTAVCVWRVGSSKDTGQDISGHLGGDIAARVPVLSTAQESAMVQYVLIL